MKQNLRRAVNLTALVLAAGLLIGLLMGCPNGSGPNRPNELAQPNGPVQPTDPSIFKTDGHGVITGYTCTKDKLPANLVIPAKIGDEVITGIGWWAFEGCTGLTSVYFPASLTAIGVGAFEGCTGLKSLDLSSCTSLTTIGSSAFYGCTGLTNLDLSGCTSLTTIGVDTFFHCSSLTSVSLPANLTQIDGRAFYGCTGLTSLTIDSSNTTYKAEGNILYNKEGTTLSLAAGGLTSVNIPETVTTIGECAFAGCTGLISISLPLHLTQIGRGAFSSCTGLTSISLPLHLTQIGSGAFDGCTGLTSISLPAHLTQIGSWAFFSCTGLISISLPLHLTQIGRGAFSNCTGLTSISLPLHLTQIDRDAFFGCTDLTSVIFADKNGWKVYNNEEHTENKTEINSADLANTETAAKYLRENTDNGGYYDKYWKKD